MPKKMLVDAAHPEETRVVVLDGSRVDDFDFETQHKRQLRGNIYLAKVTRVEPSLQAAFVDYGGNRHGFLAFSEIHPDYYQIPMADREALKAEFAAAEAEVNEEEAEDEAAADERRRRVLSRRYRIQDVIRRRQIMLIQVVKEERGNKGAALTTYLSLAGRYCVLMPNTGRGGGISRKITAGPDRKRLKKIATELEVPQGMGLIIRTAGAKRTKTEIKRDYEYLTRAWENIRDNTLKSVAPALIYEESSLVKRALRDLYDKDVDEVHVAGDDAYKEAKDFVRMLMPSHAKRVHHWRDPTPIFAASGVEKQLDTIYSPVVNLRSGGYIVINQTEALVAIDVNSGRATRERNIEQTALKTNLEAADEAARQMRLRDLAGLIVIDFIDMEESKNDRQVEKRMKDNLRFDRARIQAGKISPFGLLELSRQRRRTGVLEGSSHICDHCGGTGRVRSIESSALALLRALDEASMKSAGSAIEARAPTDVALYLLNEKRETLADIESARRVRLRITAASNMFPPDFEISVGGASDLDLEDLEEQRPQLAQRQAIASPPEPELADIADEDEVEETETAEADAGNGDGDRRRSRRRRGRRGGKPREVAPATGDAVVAEADTQEDDVRPRDANAERGNGGRRRRKRRGRGRRPFEVDGGEWLDFAATDAGAYLRRLERPAEAVPENAAPIVIHDPQIETAVADAFAETISEGEPALAESTPVVHVAAAVLETVAEHAPALAEAEPADTPAPAWAEPEYEPDQARRDRFFSRLNRWGKKG
ncbi:MAG: Rne/Rng family ribonuclease [Caulobacterales bacterium]